MLGSIALNPRTRRSPCAGLPRRAFTFVGVKHHTRGAQSIVLNVHLILLAKLRLELEIVVIELIVQPAPNSTSNLKHRGIRYFIAVVIRRIAFERRRNPAVKLLVQFAEFNSPI